MVQHLSENHILGDEDPQFPASLRWTAEFWPIAMKGRDYPTWARTPGIVRWFKRGNHELISWALNGDSMGLGGISGFNGVSNHITYLGYLTIDTADMSQGYE